jgi:hypothetical protein
MQNQQLIYSLAVAWHLVNAPLVAMLLCCEGKHGHNSLLLLLLLLQVCTLNGWLRQCSITAGLYQLPS